MWYFFFSFCIFHFFSSIRHILNGSFQKMNVTPEQISSSHNAGQEMNQEIPCFADKTPIAVGYYT